VAAERQRELEGARAAAVSRGGAVHGQAFDPLGAGHRARLHAREDHGRRHISFIGSFNLSHSGETNAENVLEIADAALAERMAGFVDSIRVRYPALTLD
jgi:hypothetical protein